MAVGMQTGANKRYSILRLIEGAASDVAAPNAATSGQAMPDSMQQMSTERCYVAIYDTAGSGVLAINYARIYGYIALLDKWFPLGAGADADRGKLNAGIAIGEVAADDVRLIEMVVDLSIFDRVAVELNGVAGTTPAINVDIIIPKNLARSAQA